MKITIIRHAEPDYENNTITKKGFKEADILGKYFKNIDRPIYVATCLKDNLAPAYKTIELANKCKSATIKEYNCNHFDIYFDDYFKEACNDYLEFLNKHNNR